MKIFQFNQIYKKFYQIKKYKFNRKMNKARKRNL